MPNPGDALGDYALVSTTKEPRSPGLSDEYGNPLVSGATGTASAPIDARVFDMLTRGAPNGSLARIPVAGVSTQIEDINPLFDFNAPVNVSGGSFTATAEVDTSQPSGYCVRLKLDAGAVGDDGYIEYWTQIASSRTRSFGYLAMLAAGNPSASNSFQLYQSTQFFKIDGTTTTGTLDENTALFSAITTPYDLVIFATQGPNSGLPAPSDAWWLRVRIGVRRNGVAATTSATVDLYETRAIRGTEPLILPDRTTPTNINGSIRSDNSVLTIKGPYASTAQPIFINDTSGYISVQPANYFAVVSKPLNLAEQAAPSTPGSGTYHVYAKTDGLLYGLNDSGTERALPGESGTFTPTVQLATPGTSSFAYSNQIGRYFKSGKWCAILVRVNGTLTIGTGSGTVQVAGLPFTSETVASSSSVMMLNLTGYTKAGYTQGGMNIGSAVSVMATQAAGSGVALAAITAADVTAGGVMDYRISGVYETNT